MSKHTWLVTGCSSGFGREFVQQILARGDRVIATARSLDKINSMKADGASVLQLDVTSPQDKINEIIAEAVKIYGKVDVLVNNAGFVTSGGWEDLQYDDWLASFDANVFGPIKVTKALLPHFRQNKSGTMVFVSSLSGWIGHGFTGAYASSKFALEGAVESLQKETAPLGLRTILMEPGRFRTNLLSEGKLRHTGSKVDEYAKASNDHDNALRDGDMKQPGDPRQFVKITVDLVKQEGVAEGKTVPFRLALGDDAAEEIGGKLRETSQMLRDWDNVIHSVNFAS